MKKNTLTMGERLYKVLIILGLALPFLSLTPYIFKYEGDSLIKILFTSLISFVPLILLSILQYIFFGKINPLYLIKKP